MFQPPPLPSPRPRPGRAWRPDPHMFDFFVREEPPRGGSDPLCSSHLPRPHSAHAPARSKEGARKKPGVARSGPKRLGGRQVGARKGPGGVQEGAKKGLGGGQHGMRSTGTRNGSPSQPKAYPATDMECEVLVPRMVTPASRKLIRQLISNAVLVPEMVAPANRKLIQPLIWNPKYRYPTW